MIDRGRQSILKPAPGKPGSLVRIQLAGAGR